MVKVVWRQLGATPVHGLTAEPDSQLDGIPLIDALLLDCGVAHLGMDKRVVAGALIFDSFIGGSIAAEKSASRLVAEAVGQFFSPRRVLIPDVTDTPVTTWPNAGVLHVTHGERSVEGVDRRSNVPHETVLRLYDSAQYAGVLSSVGETRLATNAFIMHRLAPDLFHLEALSIAVALILSDDMHLRTIRYVGPGDTKRLERCRALIRATGVNLAWDSTEPHGGSE